MIRAAVWLLVALCLCGCVNRYHRITAAPAPPKDAPIGSNAFNGILDHLERGSLHVMQIHGMGSHSAQEDCGEGSENLNLQNEIALKLKYGLAGGKDAAITRSIVKDGMVAGTYSVRRFADPDSDRNHDLFFSCITWGETGKVVKRKLLELEDDFTEKAENEKHRVWINSQAKRFVNGSFADPVIYLGGMGPYIRDVVWQGIVASTSHVAAMNAKKSLTALTAVEKADAMRSFGSQGYVAIMSDSLGSRIVFDLVCEQSEALCQGTPLAAVGPKAEMAPYQKRTLAAGSADALVQYQLEHRVVSMYMLANQLPLLELAYYIPTDDGVPLNLALDRLMSGNHGCYRPLPGLLAPSEDAASSDTASVEVVAFTDPNDALSYHLTDAFARRCVPVYPSESQAPLRLINVTLPNAKARYLFVYSNLVKAHSSGFKDNPRAIDLMTFGHH
ncbi:hypothetical protein [Stenotrophomonas oahuensis]|uniref:Lipoprotein n=1 Tax=Stenotrophomonas oahuensis TaxID=3003271 RepID=A0ABY9YT96_9GAMM|nr:hypothetical protein [Stenotrophomonas sp. A5586]WNH53791.1 hypothetical protein PDM29_05790 [Stenotrophomonas sp. A5586]